VVIALETGGFAHWREDELYQTLATQDSPSPPPTRAGRAICTRDWARRSRYARPHAEEENYAWGSRFWDALC
jgi:hypothetical protein